MNPAGIEIDSFLRLGYFIDFAKVLRPIDFSRVERASLAFLPREELIALGIVKLQETFASLVVPGARHAVPLSGGLDSRLILGALLEHFPAASLHTFTYGVPGTYDFEIGCDIAKHAGTRHAAIPIDKHTYHEDELIDAARRTQCQALLFHLPPLGHLTRLYGDATIWSGYVGDAVAGSHLHEPPSQTLVQAQRVHLTNRTFVRSVRLHRCTDADLLSRMGGGTMDPAVVTWDEQVLFSEAVGKFTAPLVLFEGFRWLTPFINTPWMDFMFSVPDRFRQHQNLMIDLCCQAFPKLFSLGSKNRLGHRFDTPNAVVRATFWVNRVRKVAHQFVPWIDWPNAQYNDFNEGIRSSRDLREVVRRSVSDLKRRGVCDWVDFDGLWRRHDWRVRNHGDALVTLASLELILKARELEASGPPRGGA